MTSRQERIAELQAELADDKRQAQARTDAREAESVHVYLTESEYVHLTDEYAGICTACGWIDEDGSYEPDARDRTCSDCGQDCACGVEWAMVLGVVKITDDETKVKE